MKLGGWRTGCGLLEDLDRHRESITMSFKEPRKCYSCGSPMTLKLVTEHSEGLHNNGRKELWIASLCLSG